MFRIANSPRLSLLHNTTDIAGIQQELSVGEGRAVASGPAGPTLVGPLLGSKMGVCLDDSYARAHTLTVNAAVFHSVDCGYGVVPH